MIAESSSKQSAVHADATLGLQGALAEFAPQHAALGRAAGLELILHPNPHYPTPCLYKRKGKRGRGRREEGRKDGSGRAGAGEKQPLVSFAGPSVEKQLMGCEVSTLPGRSLFLPFRVPPAFLLQRLGSCDCSTPLTPRLLWKPMNCLRKVSWQPLHPFSCLPSLDGLGQCRSPLCRQSPQLPAYSAPWHVSLPPLCPPDPSSSTPSPTTGPEGEWGCRAQCQLCSGLYSQSQYSWTEAGHPTG